MLVFDARRVLKIKDVRFSDINMQSSDALDDSTEQFFSTIQFEKVYHEGSFQDKSIIKHRCAEVLLPNPLELDATLQWIYCRSPAEEATLKERLGSHARRWAKKIRVSDDLQVFEKRFTFVEEVSLSRNGVNFRLAPRRDAGPVSIKIVAKNRRGLEVAAFRNGAFQPRPPKGDTWRLPVQLEDGLYNVEIELEGHLAYESRLVLGNVPF
jgi:hypothetical protein